MIRNSLLLFAAITWTVIGAAEARADPITLTYDVDVAARTGDFSYTGAPWTATVSISYDTSLPVTTDLGTRVLYSDFSTYGLDYSVTFDGVTYDMDTSGSVLFRRITVENEYIVGSDTRDEFDYQSKDGSNSTGYTQIHFTMTDLTGDPLSSTSLPTALDPNDFDKATMQLAIFDGSELHILSGDLSRRTELKVEIDVKPWSDPNPINPKSKGVIPVAILTTSTADGDSLDFDATDVDPDSVEFGPDGAGAWRPWRGKLWPWKRCHKAHLKDVDGDGDTDLLLLFRVRETGIAFGDTEVSLTGTTYAGHDIIGTDSIKTVGCGKEK